MARQGTPRLLGPEARHTRVSIVMRGVSSRDTLDFAAAARAEADRLFDGEVVVTGMPVLSAQLSIGSARSMIVGMGLALLAISAILVVTLRDARLGAVSIVPNLLPVAIAFGLWGALAGQISFAATVVGALTYGIVVDDTVHILAKYQRFRRTMDQLAAIRTAFRSVGVAVVVTSLALAVSFLPFALSGFLVNRHFGALTALTLLAALLADLLFLPALLSWAERRRRRA
jgi:predicted RND superfamily exporter protein